MIYALEKLFIKGPACCRLRLGILQSYSKDGTDRYLMHYSLQGETNVNWFTQLQPKKRYPDQVSGQATRITVSTVFGLA
jgi:hypothetical protein